MQAGRLSLPWLSSTCMDDFRAMKNIFIVIVNWIIVGVHVESFQSDWQTDASHGDSMPAMPAYACKAATQPPSFKPQHGCDLKARLRTDSNIHCIAA